MQQQRKPRPHVLATVMMLVTYLPVFFCLAMVGAQWYGWVAAALSFWALLWMHGRDFWHSWRIGLCFLSAYLLAFLGLYAARPSWDVSLAAQVGRGMLRTFTALPAQDQALGKKLLASGRWTPPEGYTLHEVQLPHARMELLTRDGAQNRRALLQLHGGAFVEGLYDVYRDFAVLYSQRYGDCLVATLDYRLAPAYPYPAQQEDAMDAWRYLTESLGYEAADIIVAGDSAGGNLALSLGLRLRDRGLPMPCGFVCMSPWADLSNSGPSHVENATLDPSFGVAAKDYHGQAVGVNTTYPDGLDATDPYLSPSFGDYSGFPPMLLQAGSIEVLLSDSQMVWDSAVAHGVDCTLTVYTGMFHVFQAAKELLPESRQAWEEIGRFLAARMR